MRRSVLTEGIQFFHTVQKNSGTVHWNSLSAAQFISLSARRCIAHAVQVVSYKQLRRKEKRRKPVRYLTFVSRFCVFRTSKLPCVCVCNSVSVTLFWKLTAAVGQTLSRLHQNLVYLVLTALSILFQRVTRLSEGITDTL